MKNMILFSDVNTFCYGGKANNLAKLYQKKVLVPNGFIVKSEGIEQIIKEIKSESALDYTNLQKEIKTNEGRWENLLLSSWKFAEKQLNIAEKIAIRSSVNLEDGTTFSFAGQFTSVLNISDFNEYKTAFLTCVSSKYNQEVISYCESKKIDFTSLQINIIIQQMVAADFSGVCFSVNPLTGNEKEMLIESVSGLGEQLVQGLITPNSYLVDWYQNKITVNNDKNTEKLTENQLLNIVAKSLEIQQFFGVAQDIEWAIKDKKLYILQARPLTVIQFKTTYNWTNADLKDGGISSEITTPFMYKLYEKAFETTMATYLKSVKIHPPYQPEKWFTQFMLFSYWNLTATKDGVKKIPGFVEKDFDEDLGVQPQYKGKGHITKLGIKSVFQGIQILLAIHKSIKKTIANATKELQKIDEIINKNKKIPWKKLDDDNFIEACLHLVQQDYLYVEGSYFVVIYNNSNLTTLFKELLGKKDKKKEIHYLKLITGLQNLSHLQPSFALWKLSREILKNPKAKAYFTQKTSVEISKDYLQNNDFPCKMEFLNFIKKYGFHSEKELNILTPNWHENPTQAITTLQYFLNKPDKESIVLQNTKQQEVFEKEYQKINSNKLKKEIKKHRYFLWLREEYRDRSSQMYDVIRTVFLQAGERLVKKGILEKETDIFFITPEKIGLLFKNNLALKEQLKKNKIIFKSFRNFTPPNEIWSTPIYDDKHVADETKSSTLKGIACSFGIVEAKVFVAKSVKEAAQMPADMILLTPFTDPAWTVYFSKIKGLITETGGVLSHGAIISREYGIPAVLGVKDAMKRIKTGDKVRLDGNTGVIEILN